MNGAIGCYYRNICSIPVQILHPGKEGIRGSDPLLAGVASVPLASGRKKNLGNIKRANED